MFLQKNHGVGAPGGPRWPQVALLVAPALVCSTMAEASLANMFSPCPTLERQIADRSNEG